MEPERDEGERARRDGLDHMRAGQRVSADFMVVAVCFFIGALIALFAVLNQAD